MNRRGFLQRIGAAIAVPSIAWGTRAPEAIAAAKATNAPPVFHPFADTGPGSGFRFAINGKEYGRSLVGVSATDNTEPMEIDVSELSNGEYKTMLMGRQETTVHADFNAPIKEIFDLMDGRETCTLDMRHRAELPVSPSNLEYSMSAVVRRIDTHVAEACKVSVEFLVCGGVTIKS